MSRNNVFSPVVHAERLADAFEIYFSRSRRCR